MNSTGLRRLFWLVIGIAALAVVGVVAYNVGFAANHGTANPVFGPLRGGYASGLGLGFGPFGLLAALLLGFVLVWLFVMLISGPTGSARPTTDPSGVDRLRELADLHDKGALSDDEFTAAKRRLLGL
ncbi:MAG: SHOCT domain-containing protein [Candidatus Limnocylindrales bacterium]|jgi:uncharacterized membrane protein